ncbi:MAG: stage II sporulation protein M [Planctomycetes bacterium]|nr:stage II sporulation protein M [Planctomycetota bacterium]
MDIESFVRERRPRWGRLEQLLDEAERVPDRSFDPNKIQELVRSYRQACSDLNHARSLTADPVLLERLNLLTGRGYRYVYRNTRRQGLREALIALFFREIPQTFRQESLRVGVAAGAMVLGAVFGFVTVLVNPHHARDLIPAVFFAESPKQRVERIEKGEERITGVEEAASFSTMLFTHNIKVSFLAFSLGALTLVGGAWILFYNGVLLGAVAAQYFQDGVGTFFVAWVGPHGALELPAIIFSGAAGLRAGQALLMPGHRSIASSLRQALPRVRPMLLGTAAILVLAGLIEGSFSQFSAKTIPYSFKIAVAAALFILLLAYLFVGRGTWSSRAR